MINPSEIPQIPGDMEALAGHAQSLTGVGNAFANTGAQVHSTFQGLAGVYEAPEAGQLLAGTAPVHSLSQSVGEDIRAAGSALSAYASEVREIKARLEALRAQAVQLVNEIHNYTHQTTTSDLAASAKTGITPEHDWTENSDLVNRNNQLLSQVNAEVAAFFEAQRRCANAINALYGGTQYRAEDGDGRKEPGEYGYAAQTLNAAAGADGGLPWGTSEQADRGLLGDIGAFFSGIGDGAVQMVEDLGALIGRDPTTGEWSWGTAGQAWKGLGTFVLAAGAYASPPLIAVDQTIGLPGFKRGEMGNTLLNAGKSIIAWDQWGKDSPRAAGTATFNVVSAVVGTKGAGAGLRGLGAAAEGSRVGAVARAGTGMVRAGEFVGRLPTVEDVALRVANRMPGFRLPDFNAPQVNVPHHVDIPHRADVPSSGRVDVPDSPRVPDSTPSRGSVGESLGRTQDMPSHTPNVDTPDPNTDAPAYAPANAAPSHADAPARPNGVPVGVPDLARMPDGGARPDAPVPHAPEAPDATRPGTGQIPVDRTPDGAGHGHDAPGSTHDGFGNPPEGPGNGTHDTTDGGDGTPNESDIPPPEQLGNQPDGSWVNVEEGVRYQLTPEQNAAADRYLAGAREAEGNITPHVRLLADSIDGAQMRGYPDHVLKEENSFKRKFAQDLAEDPDLPQHEVLGAVKDSVRYTIEVPPRNYTDGVLRAADQLRAQGYENVTFKPNWSNPDGYKGVNSTWRSPDTGRVFELQFHTPDSFQAKMVTHDLYKAQRVAQTEAEYQRYAEAQAEEFRRVDVPDRAVERLDGLKRELDAEREARHSSQPDIPPEHFGPESYSDGRPQDHTPGEPSSGDLASPAADAADWSDIIRTTDVNAEPALHPGTATWEQAQRYIHENHRYLRDVNWERFNREVDGSDVNCSRCVHAVHNSFRGSPTSALPWPEGPGWGHPDWEYPDYARSLGADPADYRAVNSYDEIIRDIKARGQGASGMVFIGRNNGTAHVFNVVHDRHGVVFLDGQTGGLGFLEKDVGHIGYLLLKG